MKYFAYGSNMNSKRMEDREINFSKRELAILKDHELCFNKQAFHNPSEGYANLSPEKDKVTEGILYEIDDKDIVKLDKFEGYPNHYIKKAIKVELANGNEVDALVYIARPDKIKDDLKPIKEYLSYLKQGKDLLSENYYNFLQSLDTLEDSTQPDINNKKG